MADVLPGLDATGAWEIPARLNMAEDARSLVAYSTGYAVLSTLSAAVDGSGKGGTKQQI